MNQSYLFTSTRLGFRNWVEADKEKMIAISGNPKVMEFFPAVARPDQTISFIERMQAMCNEKGYCYFAVDRLEDGAFIGFIGLCDQEYEAPFTPCVDIGWRLGPSFWGKGYATEGAKRCVQYAFEAIGLEKIYAVAPLINTKSISVMKKIGMTKAMEFEHSKLLNIERLRLCACYELLNSNSSKNKE